MDEFNIATIRQEQDLKEFFYEDRCDKYDYLIAAGCGVLAGLVDIFLVGAPGDSRLQGWTDAQVDKTVMAFARTCGWNPRAGQENNVRSAIACLESKFKINYDQTSGKSVGGAFQMSTKNHHMKSLAHSPDIIGLFFSVLNQFTSTSTFLSDGQMITIETEDFELKGHNFISKLFCGVANWFGHIMSDVAGSSGAKGRGSGIVIPFYELFQLCDFGSFQVGKDRNTLAKVATKVFEQGYDARFGLTMAIPVVLCDLSIKLIWVLKHYFYHKRPLSECVPTKYHNDLRIMLIVGDGTLCLMDGVDAVARSGGNWVNLMLRLNLIAWFRLAMLVIREVCIRLTISLSYQKQLNAYIQINQALTQYLAQLERIDFVRFQRETQQYNQLIAEMQSVSSERQLNDLLNRQFAQLGISKPYQGSFDDFMRDKNACLEFK